jgi:hypothetical protein
MEERHTMSTEARVIDLSKTEYALAKEKEEKDKKEILLSFSLNKDLHIVILRI